MKLAVTEDGGEYQVWAMLDDPDHNDNPTTRGESFVIGVGATRQAAFESAQRELEEAVEVLDYAVHMNPEALAQIVGAS